MAGERTDLRARSDREQILCRGSFELELDREGGVIGGRSAAIGTCTGVPARSRAAMGLSRGGPTPGERCEVDVYRPARTVDLAVDRVSPEAVRFPDAITNSDFVRRNGYTSAAWVDGIASSR